MSAIHVNVINALIARQYGDVCTLDGEAVESAGGICPNCGHSTMSHENDERDAIVIDVLNEDLDTPEQEQDAIAFRLGYDSVVR